MTKSAVLQWDKNITWSLVGWSVFICAAALYCILFNQLVLLSPESYLNSLLWSLKHYAGWLVLTPLLLMGFAKIKWPGRSQQMLWTGLYCTAALSIALCFRLVFEQQHAADLRWTAVVVNELPEQVLILTLVLLLRVLQQHRYAARSLPTPPAETAVQLPDTPAQPAAEETVLVSKGQSECLIRWHAIDFISAAGNYVELFCNHETYLLRATMKQVELRLPATDFIRIHRCHIVNISVIQRIETLPAGNGSVRLQCGQVLPISKAYKQRLRLHKFIAA
ncbi:LytR/AlgR family response regulator transcription factor [Rheinheimera riviphila]|uniref:LytR/AlgR family response regulator transcription factor n=1 Tax=Rheinheimera riviphila TaxID=1834037 RepID=UPI0013E34C83|nr:LytTR family DNA-binding domain-containing protein [Rheinheimera riviphila]